MRQELVPVRAPLTINSSLAPASRGQFIVYLQKRINHELQISSFNYSRSSSITSTPSLSHSHPYIYLQTLAGAFAPTHPNPTPNLYTNHSNPPSSSFLASSLHALTKNPPRKRMPAVLTYLDDHTRTHRRFPLRFPISPQTASPN
jgi:hypothetical protein